MTVCWCHGVTPHLLSLSHAPRYLIICTTGPFPLIYRTTSDFAAISIFSSYVPLCDTSLISPLCTDFPLHTFHSPLSLMTRHSIFVPRYATYSLSSRVSTFTFLTVYVYFYDTYDVFFLQYIRAHVIRQVASDLVSFVNNRTINSIRASLDFACRLRLRSSRSALTSHRTLVLGSSPKTHPLC